MSTLLLKLTGNMSFNHTIWPPSLYIYDDLLVYRKRRFFHVREITISYHHITQLILNKGLFFASLDMETSGTEDIQLKYINKKEGERAKHIIDQKVYHSHAKHQGSDIEKTDVRDYERSVHRLKELNERGMISDREFRKKRAKLVTTIK